MSAMAMGEAPRATDRRRQAGHRRPKGPADEDSRDTNGSGKHLAHLYNDRRGKNAEGKRAV